MEKIYMGDFCFYLCMSDLLLINLLQYFSCNFVTSYKIVVDLV